MEGNSSPHILLENDKIIIIVDGQIAIINNKSMLDYITRSTISQSEIVRTLIKCINMDKYRIEIINHITITCILEGILQNDTLVFSIPKLLLRDSDNNNQTNKFTIYKVDDGILFKDNKKYTKYTANISTLHSYMISDIKYPIESFEKIIHTNIENETAVNRKIKQNEMDYIISYSWDGLMSGSFDLVIPIVNFKFDKDKIISDIECIPQANVVVNHMNTILDNYLEEKEKLELQDIDREMIRFSNCLNIVTQFDTIFHKLGRLYSHLSISDCKELAQKYINCGQLTVHSGKYVETQIAGHNPPTVDFNMWSCCPTLIIRKDGLWSGVLLKLNSYEIIHVEGATIIFSPKSGYPKQPYIEGYYHSIIKLIRGKKASIYNRHFLKKKVKCISDIELTKFIKGYGLPRPDTYCLTGKILKL